MKNTIKTIITVLITMLWYNNPGLTILFSYFGAGLYITRAIYINDGKMRKRKQADWFEYTIFTIFWPGVILISGGELISDCAWPQFKNDCPSFQNKRIIFSWPVRIVDKVKSENI